MPLNPQGAPKPHERLEATADDVLAEIETTCCEIAEKIHNHAMFVLYELVEELEEQARTIREFRSTVIQKPSSTNTCGAKTKGR